MNSKGYSNHSRISGNSCETHSTKSRSHEGKQIKGKGCSEKSGSDQSEKKNIVFGSFDKVPNEERIILAFVDFLRQSYQSNTPGMENFIGMQSQASLMDSK